MGSGDGAYILTVDGASEAASSAPYVRPDDRLNLDEGAPAVIYCQDYGIDIYALQPDGQFLLAVQALNEAIDTLGVPAENTLLASSADGSVLLYRLSSGEFQLNAYHGAEEYVAIWAGCPAGGVYVEVYSRMTGELLARGWASGGSLGSQPPSLPSLALGGLDIGVAPPGR